MRRATTSRLVVRSEPVPLDVATGRTAVALGHRAALFVGEHPRRGGRREHGEVEVVGAIGEADRRPDRPAVLGELLLDQRIAVVGLRQNPPNFSSG